MTLRELIKELSDVDEEILDYNVGAIFSIQISPEVRLNARGRVFKVSENCDVGNKVVWLKIKEK